MNNHENKRDVKSKEYNDKGHKGHTSKRLKTETNNQENGKYITSSEIKKTNKEF